MADSRRWPQAVAPWLGIGAAPAALTLGAAMAQRHGGAVPALALLLGAVLMAALLLAQGQLGLRAPLGNGGTLTQIAPLYLSPRSRLVLSVVLALAMIGWNGFNVGLGGASLAAVTGLPGPAGAIVLEALVFATSFAGARLGNRIGVLTTLCAIGLVVFCLFRLSPPTSPLSAQLGGVQATFADMAALGGYIAVFAVRAPDFTFALERRRDLWWCVGLLVLPAICVSLAGVGIWLRTGEADVVAVLARTQAVGNLFVTLAVFTPSLTTTYSGSLALRSVWPRLSPAVAMAIVAVPGGILAAARFDNYLLPWLAVLAAVLPPLVVPMATEAFRRRRGLKALPVPVWTWMPAGLLATALTALGVFAAPIVGLAVAAVATIIAHLRFSAWS
jgi:purine-cytosine permease-like protein